MANQMDALLKASLLGTSRRSYPANYRDQWTADEGVIRDHHNCVVAIFRFHDDAIEACRRYNRGSES